MGHALQHTGHRRHVDPPSISAAIGVAIAIVDAEGTCVARLLFDEPACGMSTQHQSIFIGGIVVEGILQHLLHQLRIASLHIAGADAHIVERHRVCQLTVADACQPRLLALNVTTDEGQQRVVADALRASLHLLQIRLQRFRQIVLPCQIHQHGALCSGIPACLRLHAVVHFVQHRVVA